MRQEKRRSTTWTVRVGVARSSKGRRGSDSGGPGGGGADSGAGGGADGSSGGGAVGESWSRVIVVAATNRAAAVDAALRRPGRLEWEVEM